MSQQRNTRLMATNGWDTNQEYYEANPNFYSILARSLQRNIKKYVERNKVSTWKQTERQKGYEINRKGDPIKKRYHKISSQDRELPVIAQGNKEILVFKTIQMDQKLKLKVLKYDKEPKYFSILTIPRRNQDETNEQRIYQKQKQESKLQRQRNRKYERIRQHRVNKTSRRLYLHFKSKEEMQTLTQQTLQTYLQQRTKKNKLQHINVFSLPIVSQ